MCGRFAITLPHEAMVSLFGATPANDLPEVPRYNVCPTTDISVVTSEEGSRRLQAMRWGFIPHWYKKPNDGPLLINARGETVAEKPAFRSAVRSRRCLVPASGFYEWTKDADGNRLPWYIQPAEGGPMVFAGVWQSWGEGADRLTTVAIVTCGANEAMAPIHKRMPVILAQSDWSKWLGEDGKGAAPLMKPAPEDFLRAYRVAPAVNSNRASGAELTEPLE
ncbi:MAG: SOS response-associated peptidase [Shimia sp.]